MLRLRAAVRLWCYIVDEINIASDIIDIIGSSTLSTYLAGFRNDVKLVDLTCLIDEEYLWSDVLDGSIEQIWAQYTLQHQHDPPPYILLTTAFFSDLCFAHNSPNQRYPPALAHLQRRLRDPRIKGFLFPVADANHFTAYKVQKGVNEIDFCDSLMRAPCPEVLPNLSTFMRVVEDGRPCSLRTFRNTNPAHQGAGSGSCGIAVYHWIGTQLQIPSVSPWDPSHARISRDNILHALVSCHALAMDAIRKDPEVVCH
jgi:hypothetical protein